jgi:signal transduction histidine kinase
MDTALLWSLAETGYGVMAFAAVAASWCIWQRATPGRETTLFASSVAALAMHYACLAVDATQRAARVMTSSATVWYALGHLTLLVSGALLLASLLALVTRQYALARTRRREVWTTVIVMQVAVLSALALWVSTRLAWSLLVGTNPEVIDARIADTVSVLGSALVSLTAPLAFLSALLNELPTRGGPAWLLRLKGAASWPAVVDETPGASAEMPSTATTFMIRVTAAGFVLIACLLSGRWWSLDRAWTAWSLGAFITLRLMLLPSLLALVYFHARFLFFDVLVKRGLVLLVLAGLLTFSLFGVGLGLATLPIDALPWLGLASVLATLVVSSSTMVIRPLERWVDRVWFHRRNYRDEFPAISAAMAACNTTDALTSTVTSRLRHTLDATFVRFSPHVTDPTTLAVSVRSRDQVRGVLELGPRAHGQPYGSEDLTFVDAVAAQFTAHLHAFDAQESARLITAAELRALRAQINPHFLFNALNTLAEMSHAQPATERAILNLSRVFRYALESTQHERVPLEAEIDAVRAYLEIEAERFDDRLRFDIHVSDDVRRILIPPMLLQPLVENAITHGLSEKVCGGLVRITAQRENGHVRLTVQDDGVGFDLDRTSRRVGLTNVSARIERTGGSCRVQSIPGAGTLVTLAVMP